MVQQHWDVPVKMLDGSIRHGVATGNCVAWLCTCKRELPLVGCTHRHHASKKKMVVKCPLCGKLYRVRPDVENYNVVGEIRECEKEW